MACDYFYQQRHTHTHAHRELHFRAKTLQCCFMATQCHLVCTPHCTIYYISTHISSPSEKFPRVTAAVAAGTLGLGTPFPALGAGGDTSEEAPGSSTGNVDGREWVLLNKRTGTVLRAVPRNDSCAGSRRASGGRGRRLLRPGGS